MSYTNKVRNSVDHGEIILVLFKDIPHVVTDVFNAIFPLVRDGTMLFALFAYQLIGPRLLGLKTQEDSWVFLNCGILVLFPVVAFICMKLRYNTLHNSMLEYKKGERECTEYTIDMLNNYFLLADYLNRGHAVSQFEKHIDAFNKVITSHNTLETNDAFVPKALSLIVCAAWILYGGLLIIGPAENRISLGTYLAQWEIIEQIGASWQDIYEHLLRIQDGVTELQNVVRFLNYPQENHDEKCFTEMCAEKGLELAAEIAKEQNPGIMVDELPIKLEQLSHIFEKRRVICNVSMRMQQGMLHLIAGRRDSGKTTLLKIIGGRTLMQTFDGQGYLFVPQHLRVLHIAKDPLFFMGTLYDNLTYGVPLGDKDRRIERIVNICKGLNILPETMSLISEDGKGQHIARWNEELSRSDRQLLNIARGLVANPEVLCVHKPSMGLGPNTIPVVLGALRSFVALRGVDQDNERYYFRRPRTCIYTLSTDADMQYADVIHRPFVTS
jgi:ABC-type multidrug transport system fused ATPase/permease subunit